MMEHVCWRYTRRTVPGAGEDRSVRAMGQRSYASTMSREQCQILSVWGIETNDAIVTARNEETCSLQAQIDKTVRQR